MRFSKFKALANYSKVGKHTHMKHLFVGAWNLSGGLSCLKTSILTMLQSSPSLSQCSVRRLSQSFTTLPSPPVPLGCSLKHKQTVLLSPPGLFATFISDKVTGKRLDLTQCLHSSVSKLQYTLAQKLFFFSFKWKKPHLRNVVHDAPKTVWHGLSLRDNLINMEGRIKYEFWGANRNNENQQKWFCFMSHL